MNYITKINSTQQRIEAFNILVIIEENRNCGNMKYTPEKTYLCTFNNGITCQ